MNNQSETKYEALEKNKNTTYCDYQCCTCCFTFLRFLSFICS